MNPAGQVLITGPLGAALYWADALKDRLATSLVAGHSAAPWARTARGTRLSRVFGGDQVAGRLAGRVRRANGRRPIRSISTSARAATPASAPVPKAPSTGATRSTSTAAATTAACVAACGAVGAIDFDRKDTRRAERFDLVLDLHAAPWIKLHQPPQGYFAPGSDAVAQARQRLEIATLTGEFEKPKFFNYKASLCAHSRSGQPGCNQCIDVCSAAAIRSDGDRIFVEPHLCVGCGACTTVCPSGALTYAYPSVPDFGARIRTLLSTYAGQAAATPASCCTPKTAATRSPGSPAAARACRRRVIPVEVHHIASVGIDVWLAALAWGASQVAVLATGDEAPEYRAALAFQMRLGDTIANALGYQGEHFRIVDGADVAQLRNRRSGIGRSALDRTRGGDVRADAGKAHDARPGARPSRAACAGAAAGDSAAQGAPFGAIAINADTCTMCLACVGSCPEAAILDNMEAPQVRFIESKCVQCGICAATCPEHAITLTPRLNLTPAAKAPAVLNEAAIFKCIGCGKPLGTDKMIATMLGKLSGHSMFASPGALDRLKMCADCRVVDLIRNEKSADIRNL